MHSDNKTLIKDLVRDILPSSKFFSLLEASS